MRVLALIVVIAFSIIGFNQAQAFDAAANVSFNDMPLAPAPFAGALVFEDESDLWREWEIAAHKNASTGSQYGWGKAVNGYGYCYKWTNDGRVLNQGQPVDNSLCEAVDPSYYSWGDAANGYTYCYQYTSEHVAMNQGQPVDESYCEEAFEDLED